MKRLTPFAILCFVLVVRAHAQPVVEYGALDLATANLLGDDSKQLVHTPSVPIGSLGEEVPTIVTYSLKTVYFNYYTRGDGAIRHRTWYCPVSRTIRSVAFKQDDPTKLLILLSNGDVYRSDMVFDPQGSMWTEPVKVGAGIGALTGSESKIIGDALYIADGPNVFVSSDTAQTWSIDTVGLGGSVEDISVDTNDVAWVATTSGVYVRHPDSTGWYKNATYPNSYARSVLADRQGRLFVGAGSVYRSTDDGVTWETMTPSMSPVTYLSDDPAGNIYALGGGKGYRSDSGTVPFAEVTAPIRDFGPIALNALSADSILWAATSAGLFSSIDGGSTWHHDSVQLPPHTFYGVVRTGSSRLISTRLGVFRITDAEGVAHKVLPDSGFASSIMIERDSAGTVHALVPITTTAANRAIAYVSTDEGATWSVDTSGLGESGIVLLDEFSRRGVFAVDNEGTQYAANTISGTTYGLWSRRRGMRWRIDTLGLNLSGSQTIREISRNNVGGSVYVLKRITSSNYTVYRRAIDDSSWQEIDVSSFGSTALAITSGHDGSLFVRARSGAVRRFDGAVWDSLALPLVQGEASYAASLTISRDGVLWAYLRAASGSSSRGVFVSDDGGTNWVPTGIDGIVVDRIDLVGDTAYVVTNAEGIFVVSLSTSSTGVGELSEALPYDFTLYANFPNPFNPSTSLRYDVPVASRIHLSIFNVLGQRVAVLVNDAVQIGHQEVLWNAERMTSGMYVYRLRATQKDGATWSQTRKMILMK